MASRQTKLKIGIVGAGAVVKDRHLPALKRIPDVEVVAVCNSSYESSEECCNKYIPEATPYGNWAELVADPDIDIVWICTPPYLHSTIAISARTPSSPTTRSTQPPSTGASPCSLSPSSMKNAVAAARSSTTMPTWSMRWIVMRCSADAGP